ncbi:hypothetical protein [Niallia sp.]|uniref:hypothetical protein n=1 Tax=Niallia sp. TaxID=2837523 RepID=UPI0037CB89A0
MYFQPYYSYYGQQTYPQHQNRIIISPIGGGTGLNPPHLPPIGGGGLPPFSGGEMPPSVPGGPPAHPDGPHFGGGADHGPPTTPPPSFTPQLTHSHGNTLAIESGSMRPCLFRFTYVWLENGRGFWFYPTFVGRHSIAGYRWRMNRWSYYGTDTNRISSFQCS